MSAFFGIGLTYVLALILFITSYISKWAFKSFIVVAITLILIILSMGITNYNYLFNRNKFTPIAMNDWILGKEIKNNSEPGSTIITSGTYSIHKGGLDLSPVLYYYSDRQGWTLKKDQFKLESVEKLRQKELSYMLENITREKELETFFCFTKE